MPEPTEHRERMGAGPFPTPFSYAYMVACSGIDGGRYMIGVTGLLAPGLSFSGPRAFHKRLVGFGTKYLSQKKAVFVTFLQTLAIGWAELPCVTRTSKNTRQPLPLLGPHAGEK